MSLMPANKRCLRWENGITRKRATQCLSARLAFGYGGECQ